MDLLIQKLSFKKFLKQLIKQYKNDNKFQNNYYNKRMKRDNRKIIIMTMIKLKFKILFS